MKKLEVCFTPALLHLYDLTGSVVVVIDIFRATSSITYGIDNGAKAIIPVATVEECIAYKDHGHLLGAERNGEVVDGFDFGNSPFSYSKEKVEGKTLVLTTTNGTHAINESKGADEIVIGSFLNLNAVCHYLVKQDKNVFLLCSGWKGKVNLEDTLFAGAVVHQLKFHFDTWCDASVLAEDLYLMAKDDLHEYMKKSSHSERLKKLGIEKDIEFCLNLNLIDSVPVIKDGMIVKG
ncbi:2-phosphosulfolactate phosphatase [Solitalea koreensis]|uniref:Probable 2-phosphosulfolactate phosphatase n=1 Tax=Solitalea koreensis TaxID=543615 RepID=A0A521AQ00_9SPHI|nr:2-phosphosulfolactate phosphatase [Solitalea koreensis]SMO36897.1 2-phosphosulfolactate phosphatase [Solitalea koreensis]